MVVDVEGTGCVCTDGYYDARAGLLICYEVGEDWSASDFSDPPSSDASVPQCLECGDCLKCKHGSAKVEKGFMVSEANKAIVAGPAIMCGHLL
jgi:hypothetical protein